ncbi:N-acetylgalactosamine 6-sulfatase (GALNS) [Lentisphaera araneosa HTCC2155]|uniref:N-acetylgalactosamine 6-sulfatase (GALNS) n=1 Tax=Lentisphaera araneosa HTCC2155 TaxID=313628 RepID=A6DKD8_9BACT|nr:sulfatase-like hydrolase/transferase [Lentisphaera araneosa]EDM27836.1 N-acetylgalactosamine 6-sulfatase (GALNS) [Lentisphaera araneosa HTCC2155]
MKLIFSLIFFTYSTLALAAQKPNIILILADDLGYEDLGFLGAPDIKTPHIDALARSGMNFTQGYQSASVCGPSRAGLLTGRYQQLFGSGENPPETGELSKRFPDAGIPLDEQMIFDLLKPAAYTTGVIGKWHMGLSHEQRPTQRSVDYYYGFLNGAHSYREAKMDMKGAPMTWPIFRNNEPVPFSGYTTEVFNDEGVNFIKRNKDKPFFLYMSYNSVHGPWEAQPKDLQRSDHIKKKWRRIYSAMLISMDDGVGRLIQTLKDEGIYENTLVIFMSDNGAPNNLHEAERAGDYLASNGSLRGRKGDTYEGGIRVPYIMSWPQVIPKQSTYQHPVSGLDIVPTLIHISQAAPAKKELSGVNLMPYITGEKTSRPHKTLYWRRDDDYAIRDKDWKLTWNDYNGPRTPMLFNLKDDPNEKNNLIHKHPEIAQKLQAKFDQWDSKLPDNKWWGGPSNRNR